MNMARSGVHADDSNSGHKLDFRDVNVVEADSISCACHISDDLLFVS